MEVVMEMYGVPASPDAQAGGGTEGQDALNLGAWFQKGWTGVGNIGEKGADFISGIFDRFREADALGYDDTTEGDTIES